ncbi:hypothetical protein GFS24_28500 [Chitinophaga sp. SYP-B3965]|uniref:hypothetical protein n=1 Tax=Chitinophaga sp. SYP-B3965 TaxID=2663120 RepID=UPI001299C82B|nr:hypothetical protein [Chitinophaga sp. SYP-B3965]MRG49084.1 hypothetical protein [Chitinophaga sp. SYP-B3965]
MKSIKKSKHTLKELAEAHIFPHGLSPEEKAKEDKELWALRKEMLENRSVEDQIMGGVLQLKFLLEDYIISTVYEEEHHFGYYLAFYIRVIQKKQKEFAEEISIDETRLSRIINKKESPNEELFVRLELHSKNIIPALYWYKLSEKVKAHNIRTNDTLRETERKFVLKTI